MLRSTKLFCKFCFVQEDSTFLKVAVVSFTRHLPEQSSWLLYLFFRIFLLPLRHANNDQQKLVVAASISPSDLMRLCLRKQENLSPLDCSDGLFLCAVGPSDANESKCLY